MEEDGGNIKRQFSFIITTIQNKNIVDESAIKLLMKVRRRLNECGHCGGETDYNGVCIDVL